VSKSRIRCGNFNIFYTHIARAYVYIFSQLNILSFFEFQRITRYIPKYKQTAMYTRASINVWDLASFLSVVSSRVFPFHSHYSLPLLSFASSFHRSLLIAKCRNVLPELFSSRLPDQLSRGGIARVVLCALSKDSSCSLTRSSNWISRLARRSQGNRKAIPCAFLVNLVRIMNVILNKNPKIDFF